MRRATRWAGAAVAVAGLGVVLWAGLRDPWPDELWIEIEGGEWTQFDFRRATRTSENRVRISVLNDESLPDQWASLWFDRASGDVLFLMHERDSVVRQALTDWTDLGDETWSARAAYRCEPFAAGASRAVRVDLEDAARRHDAWQDGDDAEVEDEEPFEDGR